MRPGPLAVRALLVLALAALLVPLVPGAGLVLALATAGLLVAMATEATLLARLRLTAERPPRSALSLGEEETLPLHLRAAGDRAVDLEVRQVWPTLLSPTAVRRRARLRPGEVLALDLPVRGVARGTAAIPAAWAAATRWGLVERLVELAATAEVAVLPNLRAVGRRRAALDRFVLMGLGSRAAVRLGKGREFDRLREYVPGDDVRDVAWKATAHHGKPIVREWRLDRSQDVVVAVDRGHRMAARVGPSHRLDHALDAAIEIAYTASRMEDRVGLLSFAAEVTTGLPQGRGTAHLRRLTAHATELQPELLPSDYLALATHLRRRLRHRSLVLILTALPDVREQGDLVRAVGMLVPQHLPLVVILADPDLAAAARVLPADRDELARTLVAREVRSGHLRTVAHLRQRGALVVETRPGDAGTEAVNAYIRVKRRQLL